MRFLTLPKTKEGINVLLKDLSNSVEWLSDDGRINFTDELKFEICVRKMYQAYYEAMQPGAEMQDSWKTALAAYRRFIIPEYKEKNIEEIKGEIGDINKETFINEVIDMHHLIALASTNAFTEENDKQSIYDCKNVIMNEKDLYGALYWFDFEEMILETKAFSSEEAYVIKDIIRDYCKNDNCTDTPLNELTADKVEKYTRDIRKIETILSEKGHEKENIDNVLNQIKTERDVFNYFRNRRDDILSAIESPTQIKDQIKPYKAKDNNVTKVDFGKHYDIYDKLVRDKNFTDDKIYNAFDEEYKNFKEDDYSTLADIFKELNPKFPSEERKEWHKTRVENKLFLDVENILLEYKGELSDKQKNILPGMLKLYFKWMQERLENLDITKKNQKKVKKRINTNEKVISAFETLATDNKINISEDLMADLESFKETAEKLHQRFDKKVAKEQEQADEKAKKEQAAKKIEVDKEAQNQKYIEKADELYAKLHKQITSMPDKYLADGVRKFIEEQDILKADKEAIDTLCNDNTFKKLVPEDQKKKWQKLLADAKYKENKRDSSYKEHTEDVNDAMNAFRAIMNEKVSSGHRAQFQAIKDAVKSYDYGGKSVTALYKACREYLNCHTSEGTSNDIGGQHSEVGRLRKQAVVKLLDVMESKAAETERHYITEKKYELVSVCPEFKKAIDTYEAGYRGKHNGQECPKLNIMELKRSLARKSDAIEDRTIQDADKRMTKKAYAELEAKKTAYIAAKKRSASNAERQAVR